jgi:hypothetical protein
MGDAFVKKGTNLRAAIDGLIINDGDELLTSENSELILKNSDSIYHMAKSTQLSVFANSIELKNGILRVRSRATHDYFVSTAQGVITYSEGDGIIIAGNSTELFVLQGPWYLSSKEEPDLKIEINFGEFSRVLADGHPPRLATKLGMKSYQTLASMFDLKEGRKEERKLASSEGRVIHRQFLATSTPADVEALLQKEKTRIRPKRPPKPTPVTIFTAKTKTDRLPAVKEVRSIASQDLPIDDKDFENSLMEEYKKQMRYDEETRNLIKELGSIRRN